MFEKLKANILFDRLLRRPDINKAYAMVPETDPWYATIKKVHDSLEDIRKRPHEILETISKDGLKLKGVYYPNGSDVTVICVHGYTSHAEREWAFPGLFYLSLGYNVLIPYQRAHGPSKGKYISFCALEHLDMIGWVHKVNETIPGGKIIIHGLSMGGGIVLALSRVKMDNVKCLIADAPSRGIDGFFRGVSQSLFRKQADKVYAYAAERFRKEFGHDIREFEGTKLVTESRYPLLLSAGSNEHMEELFETIKRDSPQETEIIILPGCDHGNGMYKQTELYQTAIKRFTEKYI